MTTRCDHVRAMHNLVHCLWTTCAHAPAVHSGRVRITPEAHLPVRRWG
jgi:hypothetical protein